MTKLKLLTLKSRKFWAFVMKTGMEGLRNTFRKRKKIYNNLIIQSFIKKKLPNLPCKFADVKRIALGDLDTWIDFFEVDLIDEMVYINDLFDCDNSAYLFSSRSAAILRLNSCFCVRGLVYNVRTGKLVAAHRFNIIMTDEGVNGFHLYCYEPMTDDWVEIEKDRPIILKRLNWEYRPTSLVQF